MEQRNLVPQHNIRAIRQVRAGRAGDVVPHLSFGMVQLLAAAARTEARKGKGERDELLIQTLFDGMFRVSEGLSLFPKRIEKDDHGWSARIVGKGNKNRVVALSPTLANRLLTYAYQFGIGREERFFPITRVRAWQIVDRAFAAAGVQKPDGVGSVHVLRHSGSIERLDRTRNPKAVQDQGGWQDSGMMLKYMKTLSAKESLDIQKQVDMPW